MHAANGVWSQHSGEVRRKDGPSLKGFAHVRRDTEVDECVNAENHADSSRSNPTLLRFCKAGVLLTVEILLSARAGRDFTQQLVSLSCCTVLLCYLHTTSLTFHICQRKALPCGRIGPMTLKVVLMTTREMQSTANVVLRICTRRLHPGSPPALAHVATVAQ